MKTPFLPRVLAPGLLSVAGVARGVPVLSIQNTGPGYEFPHTAVLEPPYSFYVTFKITSDTPIPAGTGVAYVIERTGSTPQARTAEYLFDYYEPLVSGEGVTEVNPGLLVFTGTNTDGVTLSFPVAEDRYVEGTEQFQVRLWLPRGCSLGTQDRAIGEIIDDDEGWLFRLVDRLLWITCHTRGGEFQQAVTVPAGVPLGDRPHMALLDMDGDGYPEVVIGSGAGPAATVTIMNTGGTVLTSFQPFGGFTGGVFVAAGDMNGDGVGEVVCGAGAGGGPQVDIYNLVGNGPLGSPPLRLRSFLAAADTFRGGVRVAAGDVTGDGVADFITCTGAGSTNETFVYNGATGAVLPDSLYNHYGSFTGGAYVAACDLDHDGYSDIILGAGEGGGAHVRVWSPHTHTYITEFFVDDQNTGVITGGMPSVQDPRGYKEDARYPTARRLGLAMFGHPSDIQFKYMYAPNTTMIPSIYGTTGPQAFAGWVPLEPVREHAESSLSPAPAKLTLFQILPVEPGNPWRREYWLYQRRRGFRYDLEISTDLNTWTVNPASPFGEIYFEETGGQRFFRLRERPYTPGGG